MSDTPTDEPNTPASEPRYRFAVDLPKPLQEMTSEEIKEFADSVVLKVIADTNPD